MEYRNSAFSICHRKVVWKFQKDLLKLNRCLKSFVDNNGLPVVWYRTNNMAAYTHNNHIKRASWRLKSPAYRQFVQQFVQDNSKKVSKLHITGPLWGESTGNRCGKCSLCMTSSRSDGTRRPCRKCVCFLSLYPCFHATTNILFDFWPSAPVPPPPPSIYMYVPWLFLWIDGGNF